jgi:hypothetical protein
VFGGEIDEDLRRLNDEGWREVILVKNARTKQASGGSQQRLEGR